jgi:hypothetical protein
MAQSPTSKSTLVNNAAKDDMVGCDGDLTFTIADLLANDPGGAAKTAAQFFFGSTADDQANQALYMHDHGITDNGDGTFTATAGMDFSYFVQIGNKGTWSKADVDVAHAGQTFFSEGFDSYASPGELEHGYWFAANLSSGGWSSQYGEVVEGEHAPEKLAATSSAADDRGFWLDTQNSPGGINISHDFNDSAGGYVEISFDLGLQAFTSPDGTTYHTAANATLDVLLDGVLVDTILASDITEDNVMQHFSYVVNDGAAGTHTIGFQDTTEANYVGFALDSIAVKDWVC